MATADDTLAVVKAYHGAWTAGDFEAAKRLLAADLETDVPINTYADREDWIAAVARTRAMATSVDLFAELADDGSAVLLYDMQLPAPIGRLRVAEHFTVAGQAITRIRHIHDTYALRAALGAA